MTVRYRPSNQVVERTIREERILVPIGGHAEELDALYNLNEVAGLIWEGASGGLTVDQIADQVADRFDVDRDQALADATRTLEELVGIKALQPVQEGTP
jgi:hypothetical protein